MNVRKGNAFGNYGPIAFLNLLWKLLAGIANEKVYDHLNQQNLLLEEQKGYWRRTRGIKDQLLINKTVARNSRGRKTNLNMAWIDFRKDMVPHWTLKNLEQLGTATTIIKLFQKYMERFFFYYSFSVDMHDKSLL